MTAITSPLMGVDITSTYASAGLVHLPLGTRVVGADQTLFVLVQASGAITQYDCVGYDEDFAAAPITKAIADDGWHIGFAQVAIASGSLGWVAAEGSNIYVRLRSGAAADAALYIGANSAGMLDSDSSGGTNIDGVVAVTGRASAGVSSKCEIIATSPRSTTF